MMSRIAFDSRYGRLKVNLAGKGINLRWLYMFLTIFRVHLLLLFFILFCPSCEKHPATEQKKSQPVTFNIDSLIKAGQAYRNSGIDSLLPIANKLLLASKITNSKAALVYGELFTAHYLWQSADHKKAMTEAIKCLSDAEKWNIKMVYPDIYALIGNLNKENANYKMAFDAQQKGLYWAMANKDTTNIIALLSLKAMFIHTYMEIVQGNLKEDSSLHIQMAALKMTESNPKFELLRIRFYDNIAQYYLDQKEYNKTIYYADRGIALALKYNQQRSLTYGYAWLGQAYYFKGDRKKGIDYLEKALKIARAIKEPYREMEIYGHLFDCYYSSGDYKKAIELNKTAQIMHDSLQVHLNEKQISELQIKYETIKKDKEIALMDQSTRVKDRQMIAILVCSVFGVTFSIILFLQYRILRRKWKASAIETERLKKNYFQSQLEGLKTQVNPHFLFNSLNSLSALIYSDQEKAVKFVDEMSKVYRYLLRSNENELIPLKAEIQFVHSFFHMLKTRYNNGIELHLNIKDQHMDYLIAPLTLQMLIENAVKHNIISFDKPLRIDISSDSSDVLTVNNNLQKKLTKVLSNGIGLQNIITKYRLLSNSEIVIINDGKTFAVQLPLFNNS